MSKPLVAIVGRPNVGKSMLFNKLCGRRLSIVEDTPGVTRDRLYAECEWCGRTFDIVDTGGIEPSTDNEILLFMREQAQLAIDAADVVVLVTEIGTGVTAADQEVANMLLRSKKPVVLAVNKMDSTGAVDPGIYEFYSLGLGDPIAVSAVHGHGTGDLLDACLEHFPPEDASDADADYTRVAVIGKPNVGKSSLVNLILGEKRVIVSNVAGTTRDSVDSRFENKYGKYIFVDTAGIRRKSRVDDRIEKFSVMRAKLAIERADVCLIMIDARDGVTEQDTKIAGLAHEAGKASIIVVNKWDLVDKETGEDAQGRPARSELHVLCAGAVHLGAHRSAHRAPVRAHQLRQRSERHAHHHRYAQQRPRRRAGACPAADGQGPPPEDLLHDADRCQTALLRRVLQQPGAVPFFLSALSGKSDPRRVRPGGYADPHGYPAEGRAGMIPGLLAAIAVFSYLLGGLNGAIIASKYVFHRDVRDYGSGNAGLTNFYRTFGAPGLAIVIGTDVLKTVIAVVAGGLIMGTQGAASTGQVFAGFCVMLGHIYPVFYGFRGGKGVLCAETMLLIVSFPTGLVSLLIFVGIVWATRYVSLGSVCGALIAPIGVLAACGKLPALLSLFCVILLVAKHRSNIRRLIEHKESKLSFQKDLSDKFDDEDF